MAEKDTSAQQEQTTDGALEGQPSMASKRNKWVVPGVIVAVIIVLGIGFGVWHESPTFCNAVCHDPMDPYVESVTNGHVGMAAYDHVQAGKNCLSCHQPKLTEQVSEVMIWTSDAFTTDEEGWLAPSKDFASEEFCARSGCHDMSEVISSTWGFEGNAAQYNPHSSHQDQALECGDCHKAHSTSVLVCNDCHALNAPEGWEG